MKKLLTTLLIALTLICLFACEFPSKPGDDSATGGNQQQTPVIDDSTAENALKGIETLASQQYSEILLTVTTQGNGITLKNTFKILFETDGSKKIEYSVMTANKIEIGKDGTVTMPENQYSTSSGIAKVDKNGTASFVSGTKTDYDFSNISTLDFNFAVENFDNLTVGNGTLKGNVTNPQAFFKNQDLKEATDCVLTVYYDKTLSSIKVSYNLENQTVNLNYAFTK